MSEQELFLRNSLVSSLIAMLMDGYEMKVSEAMDTFYNSQLYEKILDKETGLYIQSAPYNYELLKHEIEFGKIV